jgi:hypothetical protein
MIKRCGEKGIEQSAARADELATAAITAPRPGGGLPRLSCSSREQGFDHLVQ